MSTVDLKAGAPGRLGLAFKTEPKLWHGWPTETAHAIRPRRRRHL